MVISPPTYELCGPHNSVTFELRVFKASSAGGSLGISHAQAV